MTVLSIVLGLRVPSCCRSPWLPHRLSPIGPLLRTCSRCHSLPVASPSPPSEEQNTPRTYGSDLRKKIFLRRVSATHLFLARQRSVSLLLRRRFQSPAGAVRPRRSLACGGACLRALRTSRLSNAALPLLPKTDVRIVGVRA